MRMEVVLLAVILFLLGGSVALLLWRSEDEWERWRARYTARIGITVVVTLLVPLAAFAIWKSRTAERALDEIIPPYPESRVEWAPTASEALGMLAIVHLSGHDVAAADSLRREAGRLAAEGEPRYWLARTSDEPESVMRFYRSAFEEAGWEILEAGSIHLLGVRGEERLMVSATRTWTDTRISYGWYPRWPP
jgi:hypothetical protein